MSVFTRKLEGVLWSITIVSLIIFFTNFTTEREFAVSPIDSAVESERFVPGRILLQPKATTSENDLAGIIASVGGKQIGHLKQINVRMLEFPPTISEKAVEAILAHHPQIQFAERDRFVKPVEAPNDYYFVFAWHLSKLNMPTAWDTAKGDGITIAILDTGVESSHPDLADKIVPGFNMYDNNSDTSDVHGHGTSVAGSAAAMTNNIIGISGIAWNAKIMPIRVSALDGWATWSTIANGAIYAIDHGARVANASYASYPSATVQSAGNYMKSKGGLFTVSAGNDSVLNTTTATDSLIVVAATDGSDFKTSWSTYGPAVDVSAPGTSIYVTRRGASYGTAAGTSFSAPITAATIALMMSANPNLTPTQLENILFSTALDLGDVGYDQMFGHGRIRPAEAVLKAKNTVAADTTLPTIGFANINSGERLFGLKDIQLSATDNVAVERVELLIGSNILGSTSQAPYTIPLDTLKLPEGPATLVARAVDSSGNSKTASLSVVIDNIADTQAPVITSIKPVEGTKVKSGNVAVSATATDNEAVVSMKVFINGVQKAASTSGSISFTWNTRKLPSGAYAIRVEAQDPSGNVGVQTANVTK